MEIKKVHANKNGVKVVCIPKRSEIQDGDFVKIEKIKEVQAVS